MGDRKFSVADIIYSTSELDFLTPTNLEPSRYWLRDMCLEIVKGIERPLIIDDGCGEGVLTLEIAEERMDADVVGIDLSEVGIENARTMANEKNITNAKFVVGNVKDYLERRVYPERDLSYSINTLQYFHNDEMLEVISLISENLKPGGSFLMTAPSYEFFGLELFPEYVVDSDPLPYYAVNTPRHRQSETLVGKKFESLFENHLYGLVLVDKGEISFDAKHIFFIVKLAREIGGIYLETLEKKARYYMSQQQIGVKEASGLARVNWYLFQK